MIIRILVIERVDSSVGFTQAKEDILLDGNSSSLVGFLP